MYSTGDFNNQLDMSLLELPEVAFDFDPSRSAEDISLLDTLTVTEILHETEGLPSVSPLSGEEPACPSSASPLITCDLANLDAISPDNGTTLCSVAYGLVRQHNKKGVDMMEICIRLWNGLIKGSEGEGCKVENKLLFSVLEYIRG
jgi:hypothetical protein